MWSVFSHSKEASDHRTSLGSTDLKKPFDVYCDALSTGIGGALMQEGHLISYVSWQLWHHEEHYPTHDLEL
jgi:hypothetical protein